MRVDLQLFENDVGSDSPAGGLRWAVGVLGCARFLWRSGAVQWQRLRSENKACGESKEKTLTRLTQTGESFSLDLKKGQRRCTHPFTRVGSPVNGSIHCPTHCRADGSRGQRSARACSCVRRGSLSSDSPLDGPRLVAVPPLAA